MTGPGTKPVPRLKLLLDTNVLMAAEPFDGHLEPTVEQAARLLRLANEQGHLLCVARATREDMLEGRDPIRRAQRLAELEKFHELEEVPLDPSFVAAAGESAIGTNDYRDLRILAALNAGAASYLVSDDLRLYKRARKVGLADAVLSLPDAVLLLQGFSPRSPSEPPRVTRIKSYALDALQQIFDGLRQDYPGFDDWLDKVKRESDDRICLVVKEGVTYAAIALLKPEEHCEYGFDQPVLKISTFKVAVTHAGAKFGELLLKAVMQHAVGSSVSSLYVEVLPTHPEVVEFLTTFGFSDEAGPHLDQHVMMKTLRPPVDSTQLSDLEYHVKYGPPALRPTQSAFIVPILPKWHDQLFPERRPVPSKETQLALFDDVQKTVTHPWGNAIRKAYLCNSVSRAIRPGDLLLFYRSHDSQAVSTVGIVESTLRSTNADQVMAFVGQRTVYTPLEIREMSNHKDGVLAIRFRQDRFLDPPVSLTELQAAGVLRTWPQSITKLKQKGEQWLKEMLEGSH